MLLPIQGSWTKPQTVPRDPRSARRATPALPRRRRLLRHRHARPHLLCLLPRRRLPKTRRPPTALRRRRRLRPLPQLST
ncbi:unnamed protein product [Linum tenue]|uniref:Uncharacterized protein n=1 Tax=Linum tenue TaxID=586396 RepID=A0AAV0MX56_9ROSI|nr:unnamed protein product [Linum tenue]